MVFSCCGLPDHAPCPITRHAACPRFLRKAERGRAWAEPGQRLGSAWAGQSNLISFISEASLSARGLDAHTFSSRLRHRIYFLGRWPRQTFHGVRLCILLIHAVIDLTTLAFDALVFFSSGWFFLLTSLAPHPFFFFTSARRQSHSYHLLSSVSLSPPLRPASRHFNTRYCVP